MPTPPKKTAPSSRAKKLPKEGHGKFVGPRTLDNLEAELSGRRNPTANWSWDGGVGSPSGPGDRWFTKRHQRKYEEGKREYQKRYRPASKRQSLRDVVADRIDMAKDTSVVLRWGRNRSTERARAAELVQAARKLKDPAKRKKVLKLIQEELSRYKPSQTSSYTVSDKDIPF